MAAALIGYELQQGHSGIGAMEQDRLAVQARVIEDNISQQLDGINKALRSRGAEYARPVERTGRRTSARLKILSDAIPGVRNMFILDAAGKVTASSEAALLGTSLKDRDYFTVSSRTRSARRLRLAAVRVGPRQPRDRGRARPPRPRRGIRRARRGRARQPLLRSRHAFGDVRQGHAGRLAHADGQVFIGLPRATAPRDIAEIAAQISMDTSHSGETPQMTIVTRGDTPLIVAAREVSPAALHMDRPLVVVVSRHVDAVFLPWRQHAAELGGFFLVLLVATTAGLHSSQWRRREFDRLAAMAANERRLGAERLELALRGAELGLWDWDVRNDRFNHNELTRLQLGYEVDEIGLGGSEWRALFHPRTPPGSAGP